MAMPLVHTIKTADRKFICWHLEIFLLKPKLTLISLPYFNNKRVRMRLQQAPTLTSTPNNQQLSQRKSTGANSSIPWVH